MVALGRSLRLDVVAEGVEKVEHAAFLTGEGCQLAQGYLYSRPVGASAYARGLGDAQLGLIEGAVRGALHTR